MKKKREICVDDVKVIACVLVVLGHFFQSMTKAGILPESGLYEWFEKNDLLFSCSVVLHLQRVPLPEVQRGG